VPTGAHRLCGGVFALQQGTVDGAGKSPADDPGQKSSIEVQSNINLTGHITDSLAHHSFWRPAWDLQWMPQTGFADPK